MCQQSDHHGHYCSTKFTAGKESVERFMPEDGSHVRHERVCKQGHHGLETRLAGGADSGRAQLHAEHAQITFLWTDRGLLYLAFVMDLFNREVIDWSLKPTDIVTDALTID
jgi:putative transposase